MTGHLEREVKLDADPDLVLPDLDGAVPGLQAVPRPTLDLDATYFDTADARLLAAGVTVRRRTGEGTRWTVKLPGTRPVGSSDPDMGAGEGVGGSGDAASDVGLAVARREIDVFDPGLAVPAEVVQHLAPWLGGVELEAVARLVSHRRRLALGWDGDEPVAELDDDLVAVHPGPGRGSDEPVARFREIEVEQAGDDDRAGSVMAAVLARLVAAGARTASSPSKLARALDLLAAP